MTVPVRAVLFDLDGTLVQTRAASWEVFRPISEQFGLGVDTPEGYFDLFRGNLFASLRELCRDDAHADEVKGALLERLREEYTPPMVPGMVDVVRRLAAECTLAVMSSNAMQALRRVLVEGGLAFCFAHVFGGDVMPDKRTAIRTFLADTGSGFGRRCSADYDETGGHAEADPATTVLVTDTAGDVRDALEAGIRVVGVAWGMHAIDELTAAGAEFVALWPQEITAHLLGDAAAEPVTGACAVPAPCTATLAGSRNGPGNGSSDESAERDVAAGAAAAAVRRDRRRYAVARANDSATTHSTTTRPASGPVPATISARTREPAARSGAGPMPGTGSPSTSATTPSRHDAGARDPADSATTDPRRLPRGAVTPPSGGSEPRYAGGRVDADLRTAVGRIVQPR